MEQLQQNKYIRNTDLEELFEPLLKNDVLDNSLDAKVVINYGDNNSMFLPKYISDVLLGMVISEIKYRKEKELGKGLF